MQDIKDKLQIDTTYTKLYRKKKEPEEMNHVKDNIFLQKGYNYQADVLHLPTDSFGYSKLLIVLDLADDSFDIEKMKDSEAPDLTLTAYKRMLSRKIISIPKASMTTDGASSFKSVFDDFLFDNGVHHKTTRAGRHKSMASIDNLCRQLGDLFNGTMNTQELKTKKPSKAWTKHIDLVRMELNKFRRKKLPDDITTYDYPVFDPTKEETTQTLKNYDIDMKKLGVSNSDKTFKLIRQKYKFGDLVNILLSEPEDILGKKQPTKNFRMGDVRLSREKYRVKSVVYFAGNPPYRYILEALDGASGRTKNRIKDVSFQESEMRQV